MQDNMSIAILYICTGKYNQFFKGFYRSCEKYFLAGKAEKVYYVWTDDDSLGDGRNNVKVYHKECAGFPADSLFRFEMYLQAEEQFKEYDYIYFFNANAAFIEPVDEEILPDESGLAMGIWPGKQECRHPMWYPYERRRKSMAYVAPYEKNYVYYMGGLNGGTPDAYLAMVRTLAQNIRTDYNNGIVAMVHDESHINAYMRSHECKVIGRNCYLMPEEELPPPIHTTGERSNTNIQTKIIFRDKVRLDPYFNKGRSRSKWRKIRKGYQMLIRAIRWYLLI